MTRYSETDTYSRADDWLMGAARRNPEALLLLAAGACLLMRSGGSAARRTARSPNEWDYSSDAGRRAGNTASNMSEGISRAADKAADYASDVKDRISETASGYADSVSEFADDARRAISERSERWQRRARSQLQGGMERVLREQPLAVAVAGLAAGAAVAALFPSTKIENQTFGGAREALADAAGKVGERVMDAAGKAGERLKAAAEEGLSSDGLKKMASEVADIFTSEVKGKSDERSSASIVPDNPNTTSRPGQSFGREQSQRGASQAPDAAPAGSGPRRGTR